ncbi:MAG: transglycosylase domain-containing protein [Deferribacteraceae bacterium]|jgi:penicillin-binding protein 1A|nr:transglycosylase domain-containing protein [Deferribacteraceae bacterium]
MKRARFCVFVLLALSSFLALAFGFVMLLWTQATLIKLHIPAFTGLESYRESTSLEIYAADGTRMYRRDYHFGGRLGKDINLDLPIYLLNELRAEQIPYKERFAWWQRLLLRMEHLDPDSLESFIREHYANSLTEISKLSLRASRLDSAFQRNLLQYYIMKELQGGYTDRELYKLFFDAVYYAPEIQGLTGAARAYFDKAVADLDTLELCFLVAKAIRQPQQSIQYHDKVARQLLNSLYSNGQLSVADYRHYLDSRLELADRSYKQVEPSLVNLAIEELVEGGIDPSVGEIVIRTHYNTQATAAAKRALAPLYARNPRVQAGFVMLNTATGGIEVAIGSKVADSTLNRALSLKRQMGSSFKPIVYATAFQRGILPSEHIVDKQYTFRSGKTEYSPGNYRGVFLGSVPIRSGLVYSLNNATVALAQRVGLVRVAQNAKAMGFDGELSPYFSLALGAYGTTPLSVAKMFSTLATFGTVNEYSLLDSVSLDDRQLEVQHSEPVRVFDDAVAYQTMYIMQDVSTRGTARGARLLPGTAAKTGTTDHSKDVWTVAIAYPYVIALWVGYDDYSPMNEDWSGGNIAAPVIAAFQRDYFGSDKRFTIPVPADIRFETVRTATGLIASQGGSGATYVEAFKRGRLPARE